MIKKFLLVFCLILGFTNIHFAGDNGDHGDGHGHDKYDPASTAIHHISDANVYSILDAVRIPLPTILKSDAGWDIFMSNKFHVGHHEDGHNSYNGYVMHHGSVYRVAEPGFPMEGSVEIEGFTHHEEMKGGKMRPVNYVIYEGKEYKLDARTTLDGGMLGGGISSFWDFSITKNVAAMWISILLLLWLFGSAAKSYRGGKGAPTGKAKFLEPLVLFVRDDIARPNIGEKHEKFLPFLLTVFFFIWINNLFGLIPVLAPNLTGNISVTLVLAAMTLIITNVNGNKAYWGHIIKPPVPIALYPIMIPVEIIGIFTKAFALMIRLFANITAGHILILSLVSLIFIFESMAMSALSIPFMVFMNTLELLVAALQAYIFTLLSALFIGMAVEEHH